MLCCILDARGAENSSSRVAGAVDPEALAAARRIRAQVCAKVGLVPLHAGLEVMPTARRLARAFELLGDQVDILDTQSPPSAAGRAGTPDADDRPAALERALDDSCARADRVLVAFGAPDATGPAASLLYALDGVVLITRSGGATEFRLHKWLRKIEPQRRLGVLFVE
jgi:hypothetical protein